MSLSAQRVAMQRNTREALRAWGAGRAAAGTQAQEVLAGEVMAADFASRLFGVGKYPMAARRAEGHSLWLAHIMLGACSEPFVPLSPVVPRCPPLSPVVPRCPPFACVAHPVPVPFFVIPPPGVPGAACRPRLVPETTPGRLRRAGRPGTGRAGRAGAGKDAAHRDDRSPQSPHPPAARPRLRG